MQKVYLLLRNNRQTGPHSLEELLQHGLQPFDLVWVEGKSYGWAYPSEIDTLRPFIIDPASPSVETASSGQPAAVSGTEKAPSKKIFVCLPLATAQRAASPASPAPDPIEQKAEALRQRIQSYAMQSHPQQDEIRTNYARSLDSVEEDYTSWIYRKKTKKKNHIPYKHWMAAGIAGLVLAATWLLAKNTYKEPASQAQQRRVLQDDKEQAALPAAAKTAFTPAAVTETSSKQAVVATVTRKAKKNRAPSAPIKKAAPVNTTTEDAAQKEGPLPPTQNAPPVAEEKKQVVAAGTPKEKKRSLKQLLGGLFRKNKKDETVQEEPRPTDNSNNERKATRRDEGSTESVSVDLTDQVEIKMNQGADDWMMGVRGLKLTLYNHSAATLQSAAVEVSYYSEQNDVLERKTVYFTNIASRKSRTVAAPDHRMADHAAFKILSATGVENAYAKQ